MASKHHEAKEWKGHSGYMVHLVHEAMPTKVRHPSLFIKLITNQGVQSTS